MWYVTGVKCSNQDGSFEECRTAKLDPIRYQICHYVITLYNGETGRTTQINSGCLSYHEFMSKFESYRPLGFVECQKPEKTSLDLCFFMAFDELAIRFDSLVLQVGSAAFPVDIIQESELERRAWVTPYQGGRLVEYMSRSFSERSCFPLFWVASLLSKNWLQDRFYVRSWRTGGSYCVEFKDYSAARLLATKAAVLKDNPVSIEQARRRRYRGKI